jgi:hypothetical protein
MQEEPFDIDQAYREIAQLERLAADRSVSKGLRMQHRNTITWIKAAIRNAEKAKEALNSPQVERNAQPAPIPQPAVETHTPPKVEPAAPRVEAKPSQAGRPASEWNPDPAPVGEMGRVRTAAPVRASIEALPVGRKKLPTYFRQRFGETVELEYTQKGFYHLLPEFRTFQRAVEYYRSLCEYWNIDVTPADVDLSWSRMSEPNQEIRRRVWEEIVRHAKNPQP